MGGPGLDFIERKIFLQGGEEAYDSELTTSIILNMEFRYTVIEDVIRFFRLQIWGCIIDL